MMNKAIGCSTDGRTCSHPYQEHNVRYIVISRIAAVLHSVPRATFDLDILIKATPDNAH